MINEEAVEAAAKEGVCGETFDHDQHVTYEDAETRQWECRICGAEWWEDQSDTNPYRSNA